MERQLPPGLNGVRTVLIVVVAALLLAGCSSTKLAYRYADWGIIWWVDDYVPMTSEQESRLEQDIRELRDWHCSNELPRYSAWLTRLRQDVRSEDFESSTVTYHLEQLFSFFPPLADQAKPAAVRLLSSLSDEQVDALADNMAADQQEKEEEFLAKNQEQTRQARAERTRERVERWLGSLNEAQTGIVERWSEARGRQTEIWLEGRRNWQQALLEAMEQRNEENFARKIDYLVDNNAEVRGPRYQQMMAESQSSMAGLMTDLLQSADRRHLDHLLERAASLRSDFNELTCNG